MRISVPSRAKLVLLTLYCLLALFVCVQYSRSIAASIDRFLASPPLERSGKHCVLPYAFDGAAAAAGTEEGKGEAAGSASRDAVTLVLHISADYVEEAKLEEQVDNWRGPVSLAVYFDRPGEQMACIDEMLSSLSQRKPVAMRMLSVHYYSSAPECGSLVNRTSSVCKSEKREKTVQETAAYPANVGRNIARKYIRTDFILMADYEHLFSHDFERRMAAMAVREKLNATRSVLVYRIFEIESDAKTPKTKQDLAALMNKKQAVVFHERYYKSGHSIPGLKEWLARPEGGGDGIALRNLSMRGRYSWEPQFVSSTSIPHHDEAFPYMIRDNTCLRWELCRAGYALHLVEDLFMFHRGIKTAKVAKNTKAIQKVNRKRFGQALKNFKQRMTETYPATAGVCPSFGF